MEKFNSWRDPGTGIHPFVPSENVFLLITLETIWNYSFCESTPVSAKVDSTHSTHCRINNSQPDHTSDPHSKYEKEL